MQSGQSLKDYIYTSILQDIINSKYTPNQIITEKEIIQQYNCSRSPVREALISLCSDNVLRSIPRCGYQVVHITLEDIENIQRFRLVLECGMLQFFYKSITKEQLDKLRELDAYCSSIEGLWEHWKANTDFHLYLMSLSCNNYAYGELKKAMSMLRRAYAQYYHDKWEISISSMKYLVDTHHHISLIKALEEHDLEKASDILYKDLNEFCGVRV